MVRPFCRDWWSWSGRRFHRRRTALPLRRFVGCSPRDLLDWIRGSCWGQDGCCLRPDCKPGFLGSRGIPQGQTISLSFRLQTDLCVSNRHSDLISQTHEDTRDVKWKSLCVVLIRRYITSQTHTYMQVDRSSVGQFKSMSKTFFVSWTSKG